MLRLFTGVCVCAHALSCRGGNWEEERKSSNSFNLAVPAGRLSCCASSKGKTERERRVKNEEDSVEGSSVGEDGGKRELD